MKWPLLGTLLFSILACGEVSKTTPTMTECADDELLCGDVCIDPLSDNAHCGSCNNACGDGLVCGLGTCASSCPADQELCDGTCTDTQTDEENCGACGTACTADEECRAGACEVRCDVGLMAPVTDPWGFAWDGLERTAATLDVATTTCASFGARLPTATELYRVSATRTGAVGESFHTNPLWTAVPSDRLTQTTLRLSDGVVGATAAASALTYRCVCSSAQPPAFAGSRCHGGVGSECATVGRFNIDTEDRPAMRKSAAVWECANERAHVADLPTTIEALLSGVPGSNAYIATADHWTQDHSVGVRWSSSTWVANGNLASVSITGAAPFRCAGPSFVAGTHSATVANEFVGPFGAGYKGETQDSAALTWSSTIQACFDRGGHLARASELAEMIQQGLPSGSNAPLWTSDEIGYNDANQFWALLLQWSALDRRFPYDGAATSNGSKAGMREFRCVYYPTDPTWTPPASCEGGCFSVQPPVGPSRMVFDSVDRAEALPAVAFNTCRELGGRLPYERDLTEAIRQGLPNGVGGNTYLLTADVGQGYFTIVRWTGTNPTYADLFPADMTWSAPSNARPFRCMWTNELR